MIIDKASIIRENRKTLKIAITPEAKIMKTDSANLLKTLILKAKVPV